MKVTPNKTAAIPHTYSSVPPCLILKSTVSRSVQSLYSWIYTKWHGIGLSTHLHPRYCFRRLQRRGEEIPDQKSAPIHTLDTLVLKPTTSQTNGIFELKVTNEAKEEATWTIDLKKTGTVYKGPAKPKADVTIILSDDVLVQLAEGKVRSCLICLSAI